jgi:putative ABC transport system ATP-binding protein
LDSATAASILDLFEALVAQGKTLVMVTHDESLASRASLVLRIADGQIIESERQSQPAV